MSEQCTFFDIAIRFFEEKYLKKTLVLNSFTKSQARALLIRIRFHPRQFYSGV